MSESLALFWFRYKYAVLAVAVVAVAVTGFLTAGKESEPTVAPEVPVVAAVTVENLVTRDDGFEPCLDQTGVSSRGRRVCIEEVPYSPMPVLLLEGERDSAVLGGGDHLTGPEVSYAEALSDDIRALVKSGVAVDLDNDGNQEILLALSASPGEGVPPVAVLKKNGGTYADVTDTLLPAGLGSGEDPWSLEPVDGFVPGDWNGDGWIDVIVYRSTGGPDRGALVLVNEGLRNPGALLVPNSDSYPAGDDYTMFRGAMRSLFDKVVAFDGRAGFVKVTSADVDDDGWLDAVFLTRIGVIGIVRGGADFYPRTDVYEIPGGATDVVVADFDGDRLDDIAVSTGGTAGLEGELCAAGRPCDIARGFPDGGVLFLAGQAEGRFERAAGWDLVAAGPVSTLAVFDAENDGTVDLLVGDRRLQAESRDEAAVGGLRIFGFVDGSFSEQELGDVSVASTERIFVGDFNGDGTEDVIAYGKSTNAVQLLTFPTSDSDHLRVVASGSASILATGSNDSAIGAVVSVTEGVRTFTVTVGAGSRSLGHATLAAHLGLGATDGVLDLVEVTFPLTGKRLVTTDVPLGEVLQVVEPAS